MNVNTNKQQRISATTTAHAAARACAALVLAVLLTPGLVSGQAKATGSAIEVVELKAALKVSQRKLAEEKVQSSSLNETRKALTESLAIANNEAKSERHAFQDLLIKMEALGVDALTVDPASLQQRLLKAVRTAELEREQNEKLTSQLIRLTESVVAYLQADEATMPASRMSLEGELRAGDVVMGLAQEKVKRAPVSVSQGRVVSMDPKIGLIVLNVGQKGGIRVGMPLEILRTDRRIGTAMVVDVRDSICGAVLNELVSGSDDVKIGDRIQPQPQQF